MRLSFILLVCALLAGCSTTKELEQKGFSEELLLQLEKADWGEPMGVWDWPTRAKNMGVPVNARPLRIRNIHCEHSVLAGLYDCDYLIDYGQNGKVEGTYRKRYGTIGKDKDGKWSINWVIVT